jgi:hypothetical protein
MTVAIPNIVPLFDDVCRNESLVIMTDERMEDGQAIAPVPIFFEQVVRLDPGDPNSVCEGRGMFRPQLWVIDQFGVNLRSLTKAGLATASFIFDIVFPFLILFIVSLVTRKNSERVLREFYARINTPAHADANEDRREVQRKIDDPELVERNKLFPHTNWEFWKPTREDLVGFALCWLGVGIVIGLYFLMTSIGS